MDRFRTACVCLACQVIQSIVDFEAADCVKAYPAVRACSKAAAFGF